jgi:hypothetical protein
LQNVRAALFKNLHEAGGHDKRKKITIVGVGQVGMAAAISILHKVTYSTSYPSSHPSTRELLESLP